MENKQPLEMFIAEKKKQNDEPELCDCSGLRRGFIRKCCGWYIKLSGFERLQKNCGLCCNEEIASALNKELDDGSINDIYYQVESFPELTFDLQNSMIYMICNQIVADFLAKWTIHLEKSEESKDDKTCKYVVTIVNVCLFSLVVGLYLMAGGILWDSWGNLPFSLMTVLYELIILSMYNRRVLEYLFFDFEVWYKTINACIMIITLIWARDGSVLDHDDPVVCKNIFQIIVTTILIFIISTIDGLKIKKFSKIVMLLVLIGYFCYLYYIVYYKTAESFGINKDKDPQISIFGANVNIRETCLGNAFNIIVFLMKQFWDTLNTNKANVITVSPKLNWRK